MGQGTREMSQSLWSRSAKTLSAHEINIKIERVLPMLREVFDPCSIHLFGSFANGQATESSDMDFLLILKDDKDCRNAWRKIHKLSALVAEQIAVDLLFRSLDDYESNRISGPAEIALSDGRCLYNKNDAYRASEGR
jgi:predicted nucleotidyltransferase